MENMNNGLTVPKWVLIFWPKIPQMHQNLSAQCVCPSPKVLDFNEKRLHWVSVVRVSESAERCNFVHDSQRVILVEFAFRRMKSKCLKVD
jgi:hypothetical protein